MFVSEKNEMVHAYWLPQGRPPELAGSPAWLREAAFWSETGEMRIALRKTGLDAGTTTNLVILMADGLLEVCPGDWIVWLWNNEGIEFERYDDVEFTRRFSRTDH